MLRNALLRLIEDHLFDKVTLREITAEAGVSYPTFFHHYDSKEDLFLDIAREEITDLLAAFRAGHASPEWRPCVGMCVHIAGRRSLWRTLLTMGASEAMRSEFIRRGRELAENRQVLGHGASMDLVSGTIASGTFEVISWWLAQDAEHSVEEVASMLEMLVIEPALDLPRGHFKNRKSLLDGVSNHGEAASGND